MKNVLIAVFLFTAFVLVFSVGDFLRAPAFPTPEEVTIGDATVAVAVARTPVERAQGLSGVTSLPEGKGMLFVFDQPGYWGFWMRGMEIPIDIVWIGADGAVVDLKEDVSPATYPETFIPREKALYVLEVRAGFAAAHGVALGSQAFFDLYDAPAEKAGP